MEINLNPGFFLPASEYFRRHKDVQKRHSGSLSPLLEALLLNCPDFFTKLNLFLGVDSNTRNPTIWLEIDYFFGIWTWLEPDYLGINRIIQEMN